MKEQGLGFACQAAVTHDVYHRTDPLKFCVIILTRFGTASGEVGGYLNVISFKYQTSSTEFWMLVSSVPLEDVAARLGDDMRVGVAEPGSSWDG